jgi:hypothetical protein
MKMIKLALLAGSAVAVSAAAAHADDLDALKAQIETLNARVAAMEAAPAVPAGYQLIAISEGDRVNTPGLDLSWTGRQLAGYGDKATYISVLPTADAPAGATITWSGYARAGLVYANDKNDVTIKKYDDVNGEWVRDAKYKHNGDFNDGDVDVKARGQLRATASTDTAVGEVGVDIRLRGNFNGNGAADVYSDVAWGYWSMTPELTFGGGYAGSLGNIGYGLDGACTCYYTDNADVNFNPGDTTQMRLSYGSGPFTMAVALEDASIRAGGDNFGAADSINGDELGASGEIKYSGDTFSGEISGVWRGINDEYAEEGNLTNSDNLWQVGAGLGFSLGDMANLSLAAAFGEGPVVNTYEGEIVSGAPLNNNWWGVSGLASANLNDAIHAEIAAGYKSRDFDNYKFDDGNSIKNGQWDQWSILGGIYYDPVDQLTIGVEGEWISTNRSATLYDDAEVDNPDTKPDESHGNRKYTFDATRENFTVDLVSVWRF